MHPRDKIVFHKKDSVKNLYKEGTLEYEVSEIFYECALELTGVAYSAINRAYPRQEREKNPKLTYVWESSHHQAKEFLTRYKNIVKDVVIPLVKLTKHRGPYDDSQDQHTIQFKQLIVDNNFYKLYEKLKDYGPMILPKEDVEAFQKVLDVSYEKLKQQLLTALSVYEGEGVLKESDFL